MLIKKKMIWTPDNSKLLRYFEKIETGDIIAGQELRMELKKLAQDMNEDIYIYDTSDALIRLDFIENCVRLTKSPYYNKPMVLMEWQAAFIECIYSFKMADTGHDRFKKILLLIARKNTKSETSSAIGLSEFITGNEGEDIVASSNDEAQASIVYEAIDTMRRLIDPKELDTSKNQKWIRNKSNNSKIFKLSDNTRNKEGRNIDFAVVDEVHEMKENTIIKAIEQSQSLKDNPKLLMITTEGLVQDGFLDKELKYARRVLEGEEDGEAAMRYLPWLYTQDSELEVWSNPLSWIKSNPTLGRIKKLEYLKEQIDKARTSKSDRIFVLSKDFNIKQSSVQSWLDAQDYAYTAVYDIEEFRGSVVLGAVDLAETTDLINAKILMQKKNDKTKYILSHYFIPESKLENNTDKEFGADYAEWIKKGYMTATEGNDVDLSVVADWFYGLYRKYDIKLWKCGYDQKFARQFINRMSDYGWTRENEEMIMILQNASTLSNAMRLCEADFKHRLINYNENEVDRWCLANAKVKVENNGDCLCVKSRNEEKIDGAVTLIILYETYRRYRTEFTAIGG